MKLKIILSVLLLFSLLKVDANPLVDISIASGKEEVFLHSNDIFARLFCSKNHSTSDEAYNIVESMAKAKPLYKELIKQAHPDKHPNNKDVAEELTAMINNNRFNYRELLKIKDLVNDKLV